MAKKGDILKASKVKTRDRVYVAPGAVPGGFEMPSPIKGTLLQSQKFGDKVFYMVQIDGTPPPGRWYPSSSITVKQGKLPVVTESKRARVQVKSPDGKYEASFDLDQDGVDSYITEGYTVILDDDKSPS